MLLMINNLFKTPAVNSLAPMPVRTTMNTITATFESQVLFLSNAAMSLDRIGVSEASKCRGINYLYYYVTFLYLRLTNLNKNGYQTLIPLFIQIGQSIIKLLYK